MHEGDDSIDASNSSPRYAAVVAIVPLVTVGCANTSPAFRNDPLVKQYWFNVYGKAVSTEQAAARAISPLHRLGHLHKKSRLLLVHGEKDPRVPREHGDQVAAEAFKELVAKETRGLVLKFLEEASSRLVIHEPRGVGGGRSAHF